MKAASIDIGTNSMRLLIADYDGKLENRQKIVRITRMGQGVDQNGFLTEETIERNLKNLKELTDEAKRQKSQPIIVIGTSALRDSKNGQDFTNRAQEEAGIQIRILSGQEEASLGFYGVVMGLCEKGKILVIDIGGGSTEFILGSEEGGILFSESVNIGALRMTEKFVRCDPLSQEEVLSIENFCRKELQKIKRKIDYKKVEKVVGVGGTITTVSAIIQRLVEYSMEKVHNSSLTTGQIKNVLMELLNKNLEERRSIPGLEPKRADIITAGVIILATILKELDFQHIIVSEYDNLEGALYQELKM